MKTCQLCLKEVPDMDKHLQEHRNRVKRELEKLGLCKYCGKTAFASVEVSDGEFEWLCRDCVWEREDV